VRLSGLRGAGVGGEVGGRGAVRLSGLRGAGVGGEVGGREAARLSVFAGAGRGAVRLSVMPGLGAVRLSTTPGRGGVDGGRDTPGRGAAASGCMGGAGRRTGVGGRAGSAGSSTKLTSLCDDEASAASSLAPTASSLNQPALAGSWPTSPPVSTC
jgi:hypothetical protein